MNKKTRVWLHGAEGKMGQHLQALCSSSSLSLVGGSDKQFLKGFKNEGAVTAKSLGQAISDSGADVIIDFSIPKANQLLVEAVQNAKIKDISILVGTTGLDKSTEQLWHSLADKQGLAYLQAPNTSLGIYMTLQASLMISSVCSELGYDIEIVETHHKHKIDSPSGTAKFLAENIASNLTGKKTNSSRTGKREESEIGVHSIRGGGVFGEHDVRIIGENEEITISHRALSRKLFADGAIVLSRWLLNQKPGTYLITDIKAQDLVK